MKKLKNKSKVGKFSIKIRKKIFVCLDTIFTTVTSAIKSLEKAKRKSGKYALKATLIPKDETLRNIEQNLFNEVTILD